MSVIFYSALSVMAAMALFVFLPSEPRSGLRYLQFGVVALGWPVFALALIVSILSGFSLL